MGRLGRLMSLTPVLALLLTGIAAQSATMEPKDKLSAKQVKALVASATTPADHRKLAGHYAAMAEMHEAEATEHEALAAEYARKPAPDASKRPMAPNTAEHCRYFAQHCREAAKEMRELSAAHEQMAKSVR